MEGVSSSCPTVPSVSIAETGSEGGGVWGRGAEGGVVWGIGVGEEGGDGGGEGDGEASSWGL